MFVEIEMALENEKLESQRHLEELTEKTIEGQLWPQSIR